MGVLLRRTGPIVVAIAGAIIVASCTPEVADTADDDAPSATPGPSTRDEVDPTTPDGEAPETDASDGATAEAEPPEGEADEATPPEEGGEPERPSAAAVEALDFQGRTLDGGILDGRDLAGGPVALWMWAPW